MIPGEVNATPLQPRRDADGSRGAAVSPKALNGRASTVVTFQPPGAPVDFGVASVTCAESAGMKISTTCADGPSVAGGGISPQPRPSLLVTRRPTATLFTSQEDRSTPILVTRDPPGPGAAPADALSPATPSVGSRESGFAKVQSSKERSSHPRFLTSMRNSATLDEEKAVSSAIQPQPPGPGARAVEDDAATGKPGVGDWARASATGRDWRITESEVECSRSQPSAPFLPYDDEAFHFPPTHAAAISAGTQQRRSSVTFMAPDASVTAIRGQFASNSTLSRIRNFPQESITSLSSAVAVYQAAQLRQHRNASNVWTSFTSLAPSYSGLSSTQGGNPQESPVSDSPLPFRSVRDSEAARWQGSDTTLGAAGAAECSGNSSGLLGPNNAFPTNAVSILHRGIQREVQRAGEWRSVEEAQDLAVSEHKKKRLENLLLQRSRRQFMVKQEMAAEQVMAKQVDAIVRAVELRQTTFKEDGLQAYIFPNRDVYEGEWKNSRMHGHGCMRRSYYPTGAPPEAGPTAGLHPAASRPFRDQSGWTPHTGSHDAALRADSVPTAARSAGRAGQDGELGGAQEPFGAQGSRPSTPGPAGSPVSGSASAGFSPGVGVGDMYVGEWFLGTRNGHGTQYTLPTQTTYSGRWVDNKRHGHGELVEPEGFFSGEFVNNRIQGYGEYVFRDGHTYRGEWVDELFEGTGTYTFPGGTKYEGAWRGGQEHGRGTASYANGAVYVGEWQYSKRHGTGSLTSPLFTYEGEWRMDTMCGNGICRYANGTTYTGQWAKGRFHGKGRYVCVEHTSGVLLAAAAKVGSGFNPNLSGAKWSSSRGKVRSSHGGPMGSATGSRGAKYLRDTNRSQPFAQNSLEEIFSSRVAAAEVSAAPAPARRGYQQSSVRDLFASSIWAPVQTSSADSSGTICHRRVLPGAQAISPTCTIKSLSSGTNNFITSCSFDAPGDVLGPLVAESTDSRPAPDGNLLEDLYDEVMRDSSDMALSGGLGRSGLLVYDGEFHHGLRHGRGRYTCREVVYLGQWWKEKKHGAGVMRLRGGGTYVGKWSHDVPHGRGIFITAFGERWAVHHHEGVCVWRSTKTDVPNFVDVRLINPDPQPPLLALEQRQSNDRSDGFTDAANGSGGKPFGDGD